MNRHGSYLTFFSFSSPTDGEVRTNLHAFGPSDWPHTVPNLNFHRSRGNCLHPLHRDIRAHQCRQPILLEAVEAQRLSSHLRSVHRVRSLPSRLGPSLANLSDSEHCRNHHNADAGLLLLLLGVDGEVQAR